MASKVIGIAPDIEMYYGITINTPSPSYYPIECALLNQIIYFTGEELLYKSTLYSNDDFKNKIIEITSLKLYEQIEASFDDILNLEEKIIKVNNKISLLDDGDQKVKSFVVKSDKYKKQIAKIFINIQDKIIKNFFNYEFNRISNLEDLDVFRRKLDKFKNVVGSIENYTFFKNYYLETMNKLEHKCNILENGGGETALYSESNKKIVRFLQKIKNILFKKHFNNESDKA